MKQSARSLILPILVVGLLCLATAFEQSIMARLAALPLGTVPSMIPLLLRSLIWFAGAHLANRLVGILLWDPIHRKVPVPRLLRDVTAVFIYILAITGIVGTVFHKEIGPFWAASGAGAIVIGLALRNVILDIFIGLAVNFDRPFEIGDFIQLQTGSTGGPAGRVLELNWRTTRLVTGEGNLIIIPNGKLGDMVVTNFSRPEPISEFEISVFLSFEVPSERALRVLNAAVISVSGTTGILENPLPKARVRGIVAQGVEYKIKYFLDPRQAGPGRARDAVWRAVLDQLHRAGLEPASPKQDVYEAPMPQRHLDMRSNEDRAQLLERVELFQGLTRDEYAILAGAMRERLFKVGDVVITKGESGDSMFVLSEGLLNVMIALTPGQPETRVARLQAGNFFGEMSALTGEPRSATIVAATDALAFEISKTDLSPLIDARPALAETIAHTVATRKLRNSAAAADANSVTTVAEEQSLTAQLVGKMLSFFGMKSRKGLSAAELEENSALNPFS
jgi:small-conductance mechanosensitive channel/CRP-like cAMP-binding protein